MKLDWRYAILFLAAGVCLGIVAAFFAVLSDVIPMTGAFLGPILGPRAVCLNGSIQALISPGETTEAEFVEALNSAQYSIDAEMYLFSNSALKNALVEAVKRGVKVRLVLEPRVDQNLATASFLKSKGVEVKWASTNYANTHSKLAVIDGRKVIVGSTNWSSSGMTRNREATVLVESVELANELLAVFEEDWLAGSEVK